MQSSLFYPSVMEPESFKLACTIGRAIARFPEFKSLRSFLPESFRVSCSFGSVKNSIFRYKEIIYPITDLQKINLKEFYSIFLNFDKN